VRKVQCGGGGAVQEGVCATERLGRFLFGSETRKKKCGTADANFFSTRANPGQRRPNISSARQLHVPQYASTIIGS
jgi:hypothetical protein